MSGGNEKDIMELIKNIFNGFWETLLEMSPFLLFGFFVAGILSVFVSKELVERHLGGQGIWPVIKASLLGVPLPLCSCGVIPVSASLRKHGASRGAVTSFLISTPQTGVDSIMVTLALLGPVFAIFRPLAAFITGVIGGMAVDVGGGEEAAIEEPVESNAACCCEGGHKASRLARAMKYGFVALPKDIARPIIVGLMIAGVISAVIPDDFFAGVIGYSFFQMLIMMVLGIPVYVCATASVPIAAAMILKGISPGAALVFLMTGPATNAAAITTIWKMLGRRSALIYLAVVAGSALACGVLLDFIFKAGDFVSGRASMWMLPGWAKILSASVLLVLLANALIKFPAKKHH